MRPLGKIVILSAIIFSIYILALAFDNDSLKIHPFIQSTASCMQCHSKNDKKIINPVITCSQFCLSCHKNIKNHHSIDVKINGKLREEFKLTAKKRLTCTTCHNLNNNRFDTTSWKAESLYEKAFSGKSQYKTYYLIKKNNNGQLCKTCH